MELKVIVKNKIAKFYGSYIVCGNSDYTINFTFDSEWDAYETKTARFKYNGTYIDVIFTGSTCDVPVIQNTHLVTVGVYAGDLHTTTPAIIPAKISILCGGGTPVAPSDDVYNQIMERLNNIDSDTLKTRLDLRFGADGKLYISLDGESIGEGVDFDSSTGDDGVLFLWNFAKETELPDNFSVRLNPELVTISDGYMLIENPVSNSASNNIVDINQFESDYCRFDYWAIYPNYEYAWNCVCAWGYGSKWRETDAQNIGIWSAITGEIDVFEQSMPSGAAHTSSACNVYCGTDKNSYSVWKVNSGKTLSVGELHKYSLILNHGNIKWLIDDIVVAQEDVSSYSEMPLTTEYTFERNMLMLPFWFNIYAQSTKNINQSDNQFKLSKIKIGTVDGTSIVEPTSVTLTNDYVQGSAPVGAKLFLVKEILPSTALNKYTSWSSSNEAVATVSDCGVVNCLSEGNCVITATTLNGVSGTYSIAVTNSAVVPIKKMTIAKNIISLPQDGTDTVTVTKYPSYTSDAVVWESNNESIATVSDGVITAICEGEAKITVTCGNLSDEINVSVTAAGIEIYSCTDFPAIHENAIAYDWTKSWTVVWDITPTSQYLNVYWTNSSGNNTSPRISGNNTTVKLIVGTKTPNLTENSASWVGTHHKVVVTFDADTEKVNAYCDGVKIISDGTVSKQNHLLPAMVNVSATDCSGGVTVYNYAMPNDDALTTSQVTES